MKILTKYSVPRSLVPVSDDGRGFTLIELLVVCAIIILVSAVVLASNNKFGGDAILQNTVYDMALSIREAQVYGISVQGFNSGFSHGYGVHFDTANTTAYELFADLANSGMYDSTHSPSELVKQTDIGRGYKVAELCVPATGDPTTCNNAKSLDVEYVRPEPDALISYTDTNGNVYPCPPGTAGCPSSAQIVIQSPRGDTMSVTVYDNGQISVDQKITR